ncbi:MAG: hypothetical protein KA974_01940 [Saprospiraceae bacterium]|nr:hypothetical protein [Saprospiraceae bacterium]MBP7679861.1 hypothetical protein [Saprospiraceae bacterium]
MNTLASTTLHSLPKIGDTAPDFTAVTTLGEISAVFIIDPKGVVRLLVYYPLNVGRNIEEIKRVLLALQTADKHAVALPANWQEGEKVIVPAPKTLADIERNDAADYEKIDFYLQKKHLN